MNERRNHRDSNPNRSRSGSRVSIWYAAATLSLLLHVGLAPMLGSLTENGPASSVKQATYNSVPILSQEQVRQLTRRNRPQSAKVSNRPLPKPPAPPEKARGQIVEIPPPVKEEVPTNARFVSDYNSKVEREQVSALNQAPMPDMVRSKKLRLSRGKNDEGQKKTTQEKRLTKPQATKKPGSHQRAGQPMARSDSRQQGLSEKQSAKPKSKKPRFSLGEGRFKRDRLTEQAASNGPQGGQVQGSQAPIHVSSLLPTLGPRDSKRRDGSIDHVADVEKGNGTFLNTREYRHAWFFNRLKRSVQQHWHAIEAHRRYDPMGRVYGVRDRLTILQVTLTAKGVLEDVYVSKDSGIGFLDEAAIAAFHKAQPFPNPPEGLRDESGLIRFKVGFFMEIDGSNFRMFRYR